MLDYMSSPAHLSSRVSNDGVGEPSSQTVVRDDVLDPAIVTFHLESRKKGKRVGAKNSQSHN